MTTENDFQLNGIKNQARSLLARDEQLGCTVLSLIERAYELGRASMVEQIRHTLPMTQYDEVK